MALNLHHVGIAVDDLDAAIERYTGLFGASVEHRDTVHDQGVEAASLAVGPSRLELLSPLLPETPVGRFLAKRGPGLHHVAFEVSDLASQLDELRSRGVQLIDESPRRGLYGLQVAFVHPDATGGVLAEFVER
jgi:methylmalonyl-CoA epimerase